MEIWPYEGDQYQFEFLASIDNLTVTPVPLPSSVVTLTERTTVGDRSAVAPGPSSKPANSGWRLLTRELGGRVQLVGDPVYPGAIKSHA